MKIYSIIKYLVVCFFFLTSTFQAQVKIWHTGISQSFINLRGNPVIVGQLQVEIPENGNVLVQFNGKCYSDVGDRIVLAASNTPSWLIDDGAVGVECAVAYIEGCNFSHSRVYPVTSGIYDFYAIAHNFVEEDGSGIASVYASLTVKFFPERAGQPFVRQIGIAQNNLDVRGGEVIAGQIDLNVPEDGNVIVHFDGFCYSSPGDIIVLAASDLPTWDVNDGNIGVKAYDNDADINSFSHSRGYHVFPGDYSFYAIAQNYVEENGTGIISLYGSLTVEYWPLSNPDAALISQGISATDINVRGNPVPLIQIDLNTQVSGKAFVHFDGLCYADPGDRIVLAASNFPDWTVNDGNTSVEAIDAFLNFSSFSHSRVYDVPIGLNSFYAVVQNFVEEAGTGIASVYGNLTLEFFPDVQTSVNSTDLTPNSYKLEQNFPNPFNPTTVIKYKIPSFERVVLKVYNILGREIKTLINEEQKPGYYSVEFNAADLPSGVYFYRLHSGNFTETKKLLLIK